ncbi:response regulator transcription factor [Actinoplanes solisilvae]|uniref:response regulator transcription factor n=1 Tax=Actinoplanes solisilvae TaxID=2486853 RepID=UPI000FD9ED55|nr:response regulator transcription factor [Actinoplanes solisilvae]
MGDGATARSETTGGLRVLIVDGEQALAQGLAEALGRLPGVASALAAPSPAAAAGLLGDEALDVVVAATDGGDPAGLLGELDRHCPAAAVVAISGDADVERVTAAIRAGAVSWVPKQAGLDRLAEVVAGAARGEAWLPADMLALVLRRLAGRGPNPIDRLTAREQQVLRYAARGLNRREIAERLDVSVNTVRSHSQHMLSKLGVHTTLEAVALVLKDGDVNLQ